MPGALNQHSCRGCEAIIAESLPYCVACIQRLNRVGLCGYCGTRRLSAVQRGHRSRPSRYCSICQKLLYELAEAELTGNASDQERRLRELQDKQAEILRQDELAEEADKHL